MAGLVKLGQWAPQDRGQSTGGLPLPLPGEFPAAPSRERLPGWGCAPPSPPGTGKSQCAIPPPVPFVFGGRRRSMGWRLPVLLAFLLAGPALGNEGAAAGTCGSCQKHSEKQGKLSKYPQRMKNWETCMDLVKFTFPQGDCYLGLKSSDWVQALMKEFPEKEKGAVMLSPSHAPAKLALTSAPKPSTSTSRASSSAPPPTVSLRVLDETPAMHPAPEVPKDATQPPTSTGSPAPLGHDPRAAGPASQAPQTAERGVSPAVVLSLLAVTLVAVAIATTVVCQRRHRQQRATHVPLGDPEEQIHLPHHREKT
ncbi:uncharacterized protein LOC114582737 [Podarcis muralis]